MRIRFQEDRYYEKKNAGDYDECLMAAGICSGVTVYADADSKTLTVGFDAEYPPFGYMDESGEYVGFDLDVAQKVCDNLGWELVKKPINWDSKDMELNSGNIDCIWNGFTMTGREDGYTWSEPTWKILRCL